MSVLTLDESSPSVVYLCNKDKRLAKVISMVGPISYEPHADGYAFLIHEIIEQMLSIKAAAKIHARLEALCNGCICVDGINALSDDQIKGVGTSSAKVKAIRSLTNAVETGQLDFSALPSMSDDEIIGQLTKVRGIGTWTAKMFLIFCLDRPNVLPYEDVAFLQSYCWMYKTSDRSKEAVLKRCKKWKPYSSIASRYLYRALDAGLTNQAFHLFK